MTTRALLALLLLAACGEGAEAPVDALPPGSITRSEDIPVGPECPASGTRVMVGVDDDGDGVLDDAEIDDMTVVCRDLVRHEGDLSVSNADDAQALRGIHVVTGTLIIDGPNLSSVDLSSLVEVQGDLRITLAAAVAAPLLRTVGGTAAITALGYDLPRLASVGGSLELETDFATRARCVATTLPALRSVGGSLSITCWPLPEPTTAMVPYEFPALETVGAILVGGQLAFHAPQVQHTGSLGVGPRWSSGEYGISKVRSVTLESLETIEHGLSITTNDIDEITLPRLRATGSVRISSTGLERGGLAILSLPALASTTDLYLFDNRALRSIELPALTALGTITVYSNPMLPGCQADAIADRTGATRTIYNNGDGTCP